jgi:nicotinamide-nucleotide amidase
MTSADGAADLAARIGRAARQGHASVAAAESVTAGSIAVELAAAGGASEWFHGSVVAYGSDVKFSVLDVDRGPVITARAARQMAAGAVRLLSADIAVASTGAGGPDEEEGRPPGTVFIAVATRTDECVREYRFDGDPSAVVQQATAQALRDLADGCDRWGCGASS